MTPEHTLLCGCVLDDETGQTLIPCMVHEAGLPWAERMFRRLLRDGYNAEEAANLADLVAPIFGYSTFTELVSGRQAMSARTERQASSPAERA